MNKAKQVLLTGISHGGTAAFLHADRIEAQIKKENAGLQKFKTLPVDGLHPKHFTVLYLMFHNLADSWYTGYRTCNQYPEYCDPNFVKNITTPYQQQYIDDYARSGIQKKAGNGGFFHSCYLGAYFNSEWEGTGIWNIIEINGLTMRQAVSNWWNDEKDPVRKPTAQAAWTTDCTWDSTSPEPPKWSKNTCADWKEPGGNTTGCPPPGCTLYSMCPRPPWDIGSATDRSRMPREHAPQAPLDSAARVPPAHRRRFPTKDAASPSCSPKAGTSPVFPTCPRVRRVCRWWKPPGDAARQLIDTDEHTYVLFKTRSAQKSGLTPYEG
eukprot:gene57121-biopygen27681